MKKLLTIVAACAFWACNSSTQQAGQAEGTAGTAGVYKDYLELKNALVKSDAKLAKESASRLEASLKSLPDSGHAQAEMLAEEIVKSDSIEVQRKAFASLSESFIDFARSGKLGKNTFYIQHCPMALNQKGANWLSSQEEIKNPYFGDQMLECGEVKEEIKK